MQTLPQTTILLTDKEKEVLIRIANGAIIKEISRMLNIHTAGVRRHKNRVIKKLQRATGNTSISATALLFHFAIGTGLVTCRFKGNNIIIVTEPVAMNVTNANESFALPTNQKHQRRIRRGKPKLHFNANKAVEKVLQQVQAEGAMI